MPIRLLLPSTARSSISRKICALFFLLAISLALPPLSRGDETAPASPSPAASLTTTINPARAWGKWEAWGTSLAWWAKVFGDRDDLADLLFTTHTVTLAGTGESLPGLGLNLARYNAGACSANEVDEKKMAVSPSIPPYKQIDGFWLDGKNADPKSTSWDWSVDVNQRAMLLKARDRGAKWFELFSNSPMWWMCANRNPSGAAKAENDNLPRENYEKHAAYMATIAKYAKENWGLTFTTVEALNEPISNFWQADGKQEGCHFSRPAQSAVIKLLRAELDRRGLADMPVAASDESKYDDALATWQSFDEATKAVIAQVNVHGYQGSKGRRDSLSAAVAGKRFWNSEYGNEHPDGIELASHLNLDLRFLHPTAWAYWQPLDRGNKGGWGLLPADLDKKTIGKANPKYFVLAHYTRHIRPGMTMLDSGETDVVAAHDATAQKLVLVVLNRGEKPAVKTIDLSKFSTVKGPVTRWLTEAKGAARYEMRHDATVPAKKLEITCPGNSIQTFEIENVHRAEAP